MDLHNFDRFIIAGKPNSFRTYIGYLLLAKLFDEFNRAFNAEGKGSALIVDSTVSSSDMFSLFSKQDVDLEHQGSINHFPFELCDYRKLTEGHRSKIFTFAMADLSSVTTLNEDLEYVFNSLAQLKAIAIVPAYSSFFRQDPKQSLDILVNKMRFSQEENTLLIHPCIDEENNFTIETYSIFEGTNKPKAKEEVPAPIVDEPHTEMTWVDVHRQSEPEEIVLTNFEEKKILPEANEKDGLVEGVFTLPKQ